MRTPVSTALALFFVPSSALTSLVNAQMRISLRILGCGRWRSAATLWAACLSLLLQSPTTRAEDSDSDLAYAAQNPLAAKYSLPFQNNTLGGTGPSHDKTANVLNIQPVLPFTSGDWNIVSRTIAPLIYLPSLSTGIDDTLAGSVGSTSNTFGLGDINQTFFFSPVAAKGFIWGIGPSLTVPTATDETLGAGKFSMGPAAVALLTAKPWVIGTFARQLWSVAGPGGRKEVNQLVLQPLVNYNLPDGWYLTSSPIITVDWTAASSQRWEVPVGGGFGKIVKLNDQPLNLSLQAFDYVQRPTAGPNWAIRFQMELLFPK